jgi:hypothetical protein
MAADKPSASLLSNPACFASALPCEVALPATAAAPPAAAVLVKQEQQQQGPRQQQQLHPQLTAVAAMSAGQYTQAVPLGQASSGCLRVATEAAGKIACQPVHPLSLSIHLAGAACAVPCEAGTAMMGGTTVADASALLAPAASGSVAALPTACTIKQEQQQQKQK